MIRRFLTLYAEQCAFFESYAYQEQAFHAEALGTPALEFTLLSNASRLAQSKGLHLLKPPGSSVGSEDDGTRQALWWSLYSYEKHLAYRSGIPSVSSILPSRSSCYAQP